MSLSAGAGGALQRGQGGLQLTVPRHRGGPRAGATATPSCWRSVTASAASQSVAYRPTHPETPPQTPKCSNPYTTTKKLSGANCSLRERGLALMQRIARRAFLVRISKWSKYFILPCAGLPAAPSVTASAASHSAAERPKLPGTPPETQNNPNALKPYGNALWRTAVYGNAVR